MEDDEDAQSISRSQSSAPSNSQSPPPSPTARAVSVVAPSSCSGAASHSNGGITESVTVAAPPNHTLTLALNIQQPRSSGGGGGGGGGGAVSGGGREDCWSEGATSSLIDAWGERYLELSRGNLKQKHWQEVADAVTSRDGYTKIAKTDVQCKNRIDTLKKKYKIEKTKISTGAAVSSSWPFFHRLDLLLGPNHKPTAKPVPPPPSKIPAGVPILPPPRAQFPQRRRSNHPAFKKTRSSPPSVSSKSADSSTDSSEGLPPATTVNGKRQRVELREDEGRMAGLRELTRAILRFGEVYERVETSKLQQAVEMEKQRMGFARELEMQRMQFFVKTQMELSQLKNHPNGSSRERRLGDISGTSNHHHHSSNDNNNISNSKNDENNG